MTSDAVASWPARREPLHLKNSVQWRNWACKRLSAGYLAWRMSLEDRRYGITNR